MLIYYKRSSLVSLRRYVLAPIDTSFSQLFPLTLTQIVRDDDHTPMRIETQKDVDMALEVVWISEKERTEIKEWVFVVYWTILILTML
jgi:hypothetical protein